MKKLRIILADDHTVVRSGLRALLERQGDFEIVGEAANGRDVVTLSASSRPDVVIMDVGMPLLNGIEATAALLKQSPSTAVVILSMYSDETYLMRTLAAGAKGYLLKESADVDLLRAVEVVAIVVCPRS